MSSGNLMYEPIDRVSTTDDRSTSRDDDDAATMLDADDHSPRGNFQGGSMLRSLKGPQATIDLLETARRVRDILWRRRAIAICVCLVLGTVAGTVKWFAGPSYSASLIIKPDLRGRQTPANTGPSPLIDGASLVESQMALVRSHAVAKRVVERLGMVDASDQSGKKRSWVSRAYGYWSDRAFSAWKPTAVDRAAAQLVSNLSAQRLQQSYLIRLAYRAKSSDEAARVLNAVASEYIRTGQLQLLADRYHVANTALADLLRKYGPKHPLVLRAERDVESQHRALQAEEEKALRLMSSEALTATGLVLPAEAITIPTGYSVSAAIFVGLLLGALVGLFAIVLLERHALLACLREMNIIPDGKRKQTSD